jgi:dienelactone hydrolase
MLNRAFYQVSRLAAIVMVVGGLLAAPAPARAVTAAGFQLAGGPRELTKVPGLYEWRYLDRIGPTFYDKVALHRIARGPRPPQHPALVLLYLPGTNMNGEIAVENPRYSLPVYLAAHGVDVWTLDYRTHFIPGNVPADAIANVVARWTNEVFAADIQEAAAFVMTTSGAARIFVAGFSRGVEFAYLLAAMHPGEVRGIIALDGFLPRHPSRAAPADRVVDDIGGTHLTYDKRHFLMQSVITNPDGPAPIPKYRTARENLEHVVYDAKDFGGHGGLANPQGGFSDPLILARVLIGYDRYWPAVQDYENPFTPDRLAALKASKIPVIAFSSTNIAPQWPEWVTDSAHSTGSGQVTVLKFAGLGHLDVLCGTRSEQGVYAPALRFMNQVIKRAAK